ncbi:hypothetical protein M885DRAFT_176236 [Pelagophyceae sp. CCMP2097]|nr:hypothetical protein M885DRAFT_176236 [Pelagophyceae sp. CCMP2097]
MAPAAHSVLTNLDLVSRILLMVEVWEPGNLSTLFASKRIKDAVLEDARKRIEPLLRPLEWAHKIAQVKMPSNRRIFPYPPASRGRAHRAAPSSRATPTASTAARSRPTTSTSSRGATTPPRGSGTLRLARCTSRSRATRASSTAAPFRTTARAS